MSKAILLFFLIIALCSPCFAQSNQTESLTITTYYPAPYGVYRNLKLNPSSEPTTGVDRGVMYYNDTENVIKYRTDTAWATLGKMNELDDAKPADIEGAVYYDNSDKSIKYYNGTNWVSVNGGNATGYWKENATTHYIVNTNSGGKAIIAGPPDANGEILEVQGDMRVMHKPPLGDGNTLLYLTRWNQANTAALGFGSWSGTDPTGYIIRQIGNPSKLHIGNIAANFLTVQSDGKVGVGTTTPYAPFTVGIKTSNTEKETLTAAWVNEDISTLKDMEFSIHLHLNDPLAYFYRTAEFYCPVNPVAGNPTMNLQFSNPNPGAKIRFQMGDDWQNANGAKLLIEENQVTMGTAARRVNLRVNGNISALGTISAPTCCSSDKRMKKNIEPLGDVISKLEKVNPVKFDWRVEEFKDLQFPQGRQIGMIAQEVEKEFPELVRTEENGYKSLDYAKFTAVLLGAIKEQQAQMEILRKKIEVLEARRQSN